MQLGADIGDALDSAIANALLIHECEFKRQDWDAWYQRVTIIPATP